MAPRAVTVDGLRKRYGTVDALQGVSFAVDPDEIFGLVGPNGAGKTTTLRILATLLSATGGEAAVFGRSVADAPNAVREAIRYLPEEAGAYENLTGRKYLRFIARFFADEAGSMLDRGVEIAALGDRIDDKTAEYSKGMTRRLLVASALMTDPRLAILDEPTSGLDVENSREVRELIKGFPDAERSVMLSSHDMLEVEYLCDRVALIDDGRIVARGTPAELQAEYGAENLEEVFLEAIR